MELVDAILMEECSAGACSSGWTGRGERRVNSEGASRREETRADIDDPLLGRVEVGVDGSVGS